MQRKRGRKSVCFLLSRKQVAGLEGRPLSEEVGGVKTSDSQSGPRAAAVCAMCTIETLLYPLCCIFNFFFFLLNKAGLLIRICGSAGHE